MALEAVAGPSIRDHDERDILSKYGRGVEIADIAGPEARRREKVGEVISRVCQYNRQRARAAVLAYDAAMASPAVRRQREQPAAPPPAPRPALLPCRCGCGKMTSTGLARGHNVRLKPNLTPKPKATEATSATALTATVVGTDSAAAAEMPADLTAEEVADLSAPITADDIPDLPPIEPPDAPAAAPDTEAAAAEDMPADPPCGDEPAQTPPADGPADAAPPRSAPVPEPVAAQLRRVRPAPPVFADPADEELVMPPDIEAALKEAEASGVPNIQRRAIHIRRLLSELHQQLDASAKERAIRKTIAVLEQQRLQALEELRALRAGVVSKAGLEGLSRDDRDKVREWAVERKMSINANGKIPKDILAAYQAAMQEAGDV